MKALRKQRGISLFVVMVMVLLSTLVVLWASRTALFNQMVVGNDSDYQRAFEAAQAMVRDAEFDIAGTKADGVTACQTADGYLGCRQLGSKLYFPTDSTDFQDIFDALATKATKCDSGICLSDDDRGEFWTDKTKLDAMKNGTTASAYGAHTGAKATAASNPLLFGTTQRAWYWVEVLPYNIGAATIAGPGQEFAPDKDAPFVYRITAIAEGLKLGSRAVIQTVFVRRRVPS